MANSKEQGYKEQEWEEEVQLSLGAGERGVVWLILAVG